jgi:hypothetical protein
MPTDLGEPFDITWRGDPEQMLPPDVPLWHLFLDRYAANFQRFFYNVRVGGPDMTNIVADEAMKKMWYDVNAKRMDVLAEKLEEIWIIEVTSGPDMNTVGECLSYKLLWDEDPKISKPTKTVLVCYDLNLDLEKVLKHYGVTIVTMQKPTT